MPQKIINVPATITSANNGQFVEIYTPSIIDTYQMDTLIYDFFITFEIKSIAELPQESTVTPEGGALMTERELDLDFIQRTQDAPSKVLALYYEKDGVTVPAAKILFYRQNPSYMEPMLRYLTSQSKLAISFGTKIKARVEESNSGLLGLGDTVTLWLIGEEIKEIEIDTLAQKYL